MADLVDFVSQLEIVQGGRTGERFEVLDWQRRFLADLENPAYSQIALTAGRGNGKSALLGAVAAHHLAVCGPNEDCIIVSGSFQQSRASIGRFLRAWIPEGRGVKLRDSTQAFEARLPDGGRVAIIGCDPKRAHGLGPRWVLADEPGEWPRPTRDEMYEALATALGKVPGSRLVGISTRSHESQHWFERLLQSQAPDVASHVYSAEPSADPFEESAWRAANPSWDHLPDLQQAIRREAEAARLDPELLGAFRRRRLNQSVAPEDRTIVSADEWAALDHGKAGRYGPCYLGVDLGGASSLTAAAAYWPDTGRLEVFQAVGSHPSLVGRSRRDGAPYADWAERGELWTWDRRTTPVPEFLERLAAELDGCEVYGIEADDYRRAELEDALDALGAPWPPVKIVRPSKSKAGGAFDVRSFRSAVLDGRIDMGRGRVQLEHAISNSAVRRDPAGNEVLDKASRCGRIDCLSAAVIALGMAAAQPAADWSEYTITTAENAY